MTNKLKNEIEIISKGCRLYTQILGVNGKDKFIEKYFNCGDESYLCPSCQSRLAQIKKDIMIFEIIIGIKMLECSTQKDKECWCKPLDELNSQLQEAKEILK